jgi:hypothetical protein
MVLIGWWSVVGGADWLSGYMVYSELWLMIGSW